MFYQNLVMPFVNSNMCNQKASLYTTGMPIPTHQNPWNRAYVRTLFNHVVRMCCDLLIGSSFFQLKYGKTPPRKPIVLRNNSHSETFIKNYFWAAAIKNKSQSCKGTPSTSTTSIHWFLFRGGDVSTHCIYFSTGCVFSRGYLKKSPQKTKKISTQSCFPKGAK